MRRQLHTSRAIEPSAGTTNPSTAHSRLRLSRVRRCPRPTATTNRCASIRHSIRIALRQGMLFGLVIGSIIGVSVAFIIGLVLGFAAGFGLGLGLLSFVFWPLLGFGDYQYQGGTAA